jgi:hypothetical protein
LGFGSNQDEINLSLGFSNVRDTVYDAFEGRRYATYDWGSILQEVTCSVKPSGQEEITCKSEGEFNQLIGKHFGIARP